VLLIRAFAWKAFDYFKMNPDEVDAETSEAIVNLEDIYMDIKEYAIEAEEPIIGILA